MQLIYSGEKAAGVHTDWTEKRIIWRNRKGRLKELRIGLCQSRVCFR